MLKVFLALTCAFLAAPLLGADSMQDSFHALMCAFLATPLLGAVLPLKDWITLRDACARFPTRPHRNTVIRWATRGLYGAKLKTIRYGGKRLTSPEWVEEFSQHLLNNSPTCAIDEKCEVESERLESAEARLDAMGIR